MDYTLSFYSTYTILSRHAATYASLNQEHCIGIGGNNQLVLDHIIINKAGYEMDAVYVNSTLMSIKSQTSYIVNAWWTQPVAHWKLVETHTVVVEPPSACPITAYPLFDLISNCFPWFAAYATTAAWRIWTSRWASSTENTHRHHRLKML